MENASKALLIAAGMLVTVLIISMLVLFYNRVSTYYEQQHEFTVIEQTEKFNAQFENYHRNDIRGNELISFMNKIIDYNATESYFEGTGYERIRVTITLGDTLNQFKYDENDITSYNKYLMQKITNINATGAHWENDKRLVEITNTSSDLCETARNYGINNMTDTKLQQLASGIANIIVDETNDDSSSRTNRFKRALLIEDVLGIKVGSSSDCDIRIDKSTGKTLVRYRNN